MNCPFDSSTELVDLSGKEAALKLLSVLVAERGTMYAMARSSAANVKKGSLRQCPKCHWIGIFAA